MRVLELDVNQMNDLEIKGILHDFIAKAENREQLIRYVEALKEADDASFWQNYTLEQKAEIENAIEESYEPENWVSHEKVMSRYSMWTYIDSYSF